MPNPSNPAAKLRVTDLAKVHGFDTLATKRGTDWRAWTGLTSSHNQFDDGVHAGGSALCFRHSWIGFAGGGMLEFRRCAISSRAHDGDFVNLEATCILLPLLVRHYDQSNLVPHWRSTNFFILSIAHGKAAKIFGSRESMVSFDRHILYISISQTSQYIHILQGASSIALHYSAVLYCITNASRSND